MDDPLAELENAENELQHAHRRVVEAVASLPLGWEATTVIIDRVDKLGVVVVNWTERSAELRRVYAALKDRRKA